MSRKRVIWSEGLFLRPQHFQQLERSVEMLVESRAAGLLAPGWGFTSLRLDDEALKIGRLSIKAARGVMPDGTPFSIPEEYAAPLALEIGTEVKETLVHLALPLVRSGMPEFAVDAGPSTALARFVGQDLRVEDNVLGVGDPADMKLGQLNLRLMLDDDPRSGFCSIAVARIVERRSTGQLILDESFIAPALDCRGSSRLQDFLIEARNLVRHRADTLAARLNQSQQKGVGEIGDFMMLQVANRYDPWLTHLGERESLHPEALYTVLVQAAGEFSTFSDRRRRRARVQAIYRHEDLKNTFEPLMFDIRELLTEVINPNAVPIPLQERAAGLYTGMVPDVDLLHNAQFVLCVNADRPAEYVRGRFPPQVKIGPPDKIRDLVRLHLPGIDVEPLPMAPPRMPYYAGYTYFQLDRSGDLWKQLDVTKVIALHIAGDFPGLQLELWALKP
ncbi:type VI secretion system baseplate subunit TssK [Scleromatobacter humisilvae]|uniref:Type VI secretion system baseplate subunit TssK n=1 Tax=Scleromatobacter humisilvae TaxID=2897159 RepID=A0A9X1YNY5_9BURK|nr:type VI secretion system baseplate subunit TssK [Scleromatobacter humisilvae]MCK9689729.1 type VI secretion system baseplate subunit TssK [Scleromatobacter humisilvae]